MDHDPRNAWNAAKMVSTPQFVGRVIGNYRVLELLGSGGMGAVYRAEDTRLGRQVALKLLLDDSLLDPELIERFRREARASSALHHPYICTVFDAGEDNGIPFIAMELLEGETLAERIASHPMITATVLKLAVQICDGLEFAHEKGFVHRDLKPSNIFATTRGDIKLLDFGLAKKVRAEDAGNALDLTTAVTLQGQLLGTAPYMSPEQAEGKPVDLRSDLFSLGAVLYEMSTGVRAFPGDSTATILVGVMRGEPRPARIMNPEVPGELQRILAKAMEKEPSERYQSAKELAVDLRRLGKELSGPIPAVTAAAATPPRRLWLGIKPLWYGVAAALVAAVVLVIALFPIPVNAPLDVKQITFSSTPKVGPLLTDGSRLYFGSRDQTVEMAMTGGMVAPMRSLESGMQLWDVSADSSKLLAWRPDPDDEVNRGTILVGPMLGGSLRKLNDVPSQAAKWSADGQSVFFADLEALYTCDADGGNQKKLWSAPGTIQYLDVSPDGKQLAATVDNGTGLHIWIVRTDGTRPSLMTSGLPKESDEFYGRWSADNRHFIFSSGLEGHTNLYELVAPPWFKFWRKPTAVRITGNEVNIIDFVPSRGGKGLFALGQMDQGETLVFDPRSRHMLPFLNGASLVEFAISPDRQWMAYSEWPSGHLWKSRLDGSDPVQLNNAPAFMFEWSPDGTSIVYSDWKKIYVVSADGGTPKQVMQTNFQEVAPTWSADGKQIYFNFYPYPNQPTLGLRILDLATRKISMMPGADKFFEATWSPDHQHLVALADHPSRMVLYTVATGKWTDLTTFQSPAGYWVWTADSKALFIDLVEGQNGIYRLSVPDGKWEKISDLEANTYPIDSFLSLSPDGQPAIMSHTGVAQIYSLNLK
jgi:Tol biopolymer transport system component